MFSFRHAVTVQGSKSIVGNINLLDHPVCHVTVCYMLCGLHRTDVALRFIGCNLIDQRLYQILPNYPR